MINIAIRILFIGGILCLQACSGREKPVDQSVDGTEFFTPSPSMVPAQEVFLLETGAPMPAFRLPGADGRYYSSDDFSDRDALVIIFTCNHCPTAQAYEQRMMDIVEDYRQKNVGLVAISPNSPAALLLEECGYSDLGDSFEDMVIRARDAGFNFPYLYDGDDHAVSLQYGPVATPHAYVFDKDRKLVYSGRLDSTEKPGTAQAEDLRNAIDAALEGRSLEEPVTKTFGCSVKWAWKDEWTVRINEEWAGREVTLENLNVDGVRALVANDSDKLRLINIWATWCGPCVIEYPEFVDIHRMYQGRDFEFVSLSADKTEQRDRALKFLRDKQSAVRNYIYDGPDMYALIEAIDPEWDGALPYTMLVEPGGARIYRKMGVVDPLELKRAIVEHPMIGRYY